MGGGEAMKILRGVPKIFTHPKGGLWENCWARRGALKFYYQTGGWGGGGVVESS